MQRGADAKDKKRWQAPQSAVRSIDGDPSSPDELAAYGERTHNLEYGLETGTCQEGLVCATRPQVWF